MGLNDDRACIYIYPNNKVTRNNYSAWPDFFCSKIHSESEVIPDRMYSLDTDQKIQNALADNSMSFDFRSPGLLCKSNVRSQIII